MTLAEETREAVLKSGEGAVRKVERVDPSKAVRAMILMAKGSSHLAISKELGMSRHTLARLQRDHAEHLRKWRQKEILEVAQMAEKTRELVRQKLARMDPQEAANEADREARLAQLDRTGLKELVIPVAILYDKFERMAGAPDIRVEVSHKVPSLDRLREAMEEARSEIRVEGRVVEDAAE